MPMPLWFGQVNKRVFNKLELKKGTRPVLIHSGRKSFRRYETPLDAHRVADGFVFILVYGSESDWVKNVLASGSAVLRQEGEELTLVAPELISEEAAWTVLPSTAKQPPKFLRISEYLHMRITEGQPTTEKTAGRKENT